MSQARLKLVVDNTPSLINNLPSNNRGKNVSKYLKLSKLLKEASKLELTEHVERIKTQQKDIIKKIKEISMKNSNDDKFDMITNFLKSKDLSYSLENIETNLEDLLQISQINIQGASFKIISVNGVWPDNLNYYNFLILFRSTAKIEVVLKTIANEIESNSENIAMTNSDYIETINYYLNQDKEQKVTLKTAPKKVLIDLSNHFSLVSEKNSQKEQERTKESQKLWNRIKSLFSKNEPIRDNVIKFTPKEVQPQQLPPLDFDPKNAS